VCAGKLGVRCYTCARLLSDIFGRPAITHAFLFGAVAGTVRFPTQPNHESPTRGPRPDVSRTRRTVLRQGVREPSNDQSHIRATSVEKSYSEYIAIANAKTPPLVVQREGGRAAVPSLHGRVECDASERALVVVHRLYP